MNVIDIKSLLCDERVLKVIAHSQYKPTPETLHRLVSQYEADEDILAFAYKDGGLIKGVIVLKRIPCKNLEILSIAVDPMYRKQGIASRLISFVTGRQQCSIILAETDDDAVSFYRKCGFDINCLGEKYPGIIRYLCTLKIP